MIVDLRAEQPNPPPLYNGKRKHRIAGGKVVTRDPATVDAIVLHQTACVFGKAAHQPTRHHRALGVACHALAFNDGVVVLANPLRSWVNHGNGFNSRSLGLEVECNARGLVADPKTVSGLEVPPTPEAIAAGREAIAALVKLGRAEGMPIRYILAHRQSSPTRRSDPGEQLWKALVVDYAVPVLGLLAQPELVMTDLKGRPGRPLPPQWDPGGVRAY